MTWPSWAYVVGILTGGGAAAWPFVAAGTGILVIPVLGGALRAVLALFYLAGILNGVATRTDLPRSLPPDPGEARPRLLEGVVRAATWTRAGATFSVEPGDGTRVRISGPLSRAPRPGSVVAVYGEPGRRPRRNPGQAGPRPDERRLWVRANEAVFVRGVRRTPEGVLFRLRAWLRDRLGQHYCGEDLGLARALLVGDRSGLSPELVDGFRRLGLSHLLAISGMHVGFIAGLALVITRTLWPTSRRWAPLVGCVLLLYAPVAGASGSVCRASIMAFGGLILFARRRRFDPLNVLAITLLVTSAWDPAAVRTPAYALSYLATGGILLFLRIGNWFTKGPGWRRAVTWLGISAAAVITTAPAVAAFFGSVPLGGIVYSIPCGLLVALTVVPGFLGLLTAWAPAVSGVFFAAAWPAMELLTRVSRCGLASPAVHLAPATAFGALFVATAVIVGGHSRQARWGRSAGLVICAAAAVLSGVHPGGRPSLVVFDVGAGDALLVRPRGGHDWLIDTGRPESARSLVRALRAMNARRVHLLVTHPDADHDGGLPEVIRSRLVRTLVLPETERDGARERYKIPDEIPLRFIARGDTLWKGATGTCVCLHPARADGDLVDNARSVVLRLTCDGVVTLLPGDLEGDGSRRLLERSGDGELVTTLLKVAHHGSANATSDDFLSKTRPRLALISCGRPPPFSTLDRLEGAGARVCRTDRLGAIRVRFAGADSRIEHWCGGWRAVPAAEGFLRRLGPCDRNAPSRRSDATQAPFSGIRRGREPGRSGIGTWIKPGGAARCVA